MKRTNSSKLAAALALVFAAHSAHAITFVYGKLGYQLPIENIDGYGRDASKEPFTLKRPILNGASEQHARKASGDRFSAGKADLVNGIAAGKADLVDAILVAGGSGKIKFNEYNLPIENLDTKPHAASEAYIRDVRKHDLAAGKIKFNEAKPTIENDQIAVFTTKIDW